VTAVNEWLASLNVEFLGITLSRYVLMFLALFGGFVASAIVQFLLKRLVHLTKNTNSNLDDLIIKALTRPAKWVCILAGFYVVVRLLPDGTGYETAQHFMMNGVRVAFILISMWAGFRLTDALTEFLLSMASLTDSKLDDQLVPIGKTSLKVFVVAVGMLWVLQTLGYSIGGLLAGMGIGGMALALAAKDTLANFFGSVLVFLDQPFHVGDAVKLAGVEGVVEEVGIRTTRVRTFTNTQVTLPNSQITTNAVENYSRRQKRRIRMTIGLTYGSTAAQIRDAILRISAYINESDDFVEDSGVVRFTDYGASSMDVFVQCFTKTTAYADHLEVKERLNFKIMEIVESLGLDFAFPSQTVYFEPDSPVTVQQQS
jgi:MscS family membrane protein